MVLPPRYPVSKVPAILREHAAWIESATASTAERRAHVTSFDAGAIPQRVFLPGIGIEWRVELTASSAPGVRGRAAVDRLVLTGNISDAAACNRAIRAAVGRAARERLPLMLGGIEAETAWSATKVSVRRQRTRWGSCSARRAVSLNESLVFLPPHLVRHVLVHELAHTERLDHSPAFWSLVERHDASWRDHRRELKDAWRHVPPWFPEREVSRDDV